MRKAFTVGRMKPTTANYAEVFIFTDACTVAFQVGKSKVIFLNLDYVNEIILLGNPFINPVKAKMKPNCFDSAVIRIHDLLMTVTITSKRTYDDLSYTKGRLTMRHLEVKVNSSFWALLLFRAPLD